MHAYIHTYIHTYIDTYIHVDHAVREARRIEAYGITEGELKQARATILNTVQQVKYVCIYRVHALVCVFVIRIYVRVLYMYVCTCFFLCVSYT
jgi:hypothetical protein